MEFKNPYSAASLLGLYLPSIFVPSLLVVQPAQCWTTERGGGGGGGGGESVVTVLKQLCPF
jgi:hypothetical protein